ncbi:MAG: hypothetical protein PHI41_02965 [Erysipelotrichaceae bacterium]|nr:hypothetical protein [Erysipelotrichaceae bacterium]MDD3809287.1 hypothetical protein [Erysipelotrichaceae bacterium]
MPIPGITRIHRLEYKLGGAGIDLDVTELESINGALAKLDIDKTYF